MLVNYYIMQNQTIHLVAQVCPFILVFFNYYLAY